MRPKRTAFKKLAVPMLMLVLGGLAAAQDLAKLLPEETFLALGMHDLKGASDKLGDFSAEFSRLDVGGALSALAAPSSASGGATSGGTMSGGTTSGGSRTGGSRVGGVIAATENLSAEQKQAVATLGSLEVLGQEAWLALSASPYSPLPALTMVTKVTPAGAKQVQALLDKAGTQGVETLQESGATFYQLKLKGTEPLQVLAYTLTDDLLALSTNPDELRGVLRRYQGANEPNFETAKNYGDTLGTLKKGTFYSFFDYARIADVAAPYAQNLGFDPLVKRLSQAFATAGAVGGVVQLTNDGLVSEGFQATNQGGGDASLYALLNADTAAATNVTVPSEALSFSATALNWSGWYDYLNELARNVPQLGGDLDSLILSFTGLTLRDSIFSWTGNQLVTVTTGLSGAAQPGVPSDNLLGESVYLIEAKNAAAAERGLGELLQNLSQVASSLGSAQGSGGQPQRSQETIAGVNVTRFDLSPSATLFYTVQNGYALIGTSQAAMAATLSASTRGGQTDLFKGVPGGATSYTYTDDKATYRNLAQTLSTQIQTVAGMGGGANLNFAAVEKASSVAEKFLTFVASRLSSTTAYSERANGGIRSHSETGVTWKQ